MFPLTTYFAFLQDFSTGKTFCFFTFNMFQILLITFPQGFHVTLYCLVFQTLSTVVIVLLFQCICCQDLTFFFIFFYFKNGSQVFFSIFIFPFVILATFFSILQQSHCFDLLFVFQNPVACFKQLVFKKCYFLPMAFNEFPLLDDFQSRS